MKSFFYRASFRYLKSKVCISLHRGYSTCELPYVSIPLKMFKCKCSLSYCTLSWQNRRKIAIKWEKRKRNTFVVIMYSSTSRIPTNLFKNQHTCIFSNLWSRSNTPVVMNCRCLTKVASGLAHYFLRFFVCLLIMLVLPDKCEIEPDFMLWKYPEQCLILW